MDSNEHGTIEQNEEHLVANISIYYTHETELYAESYDVLNRCTYCKNKMTREKSREGKKSTVLDWIGARGSPELAGQPELGRREREEAAGVEGTGSGAPLAGPCSGDFPFPRLWRSSISAPDLDRRG